MTNKKKNFFGLLRVVIFLTVFLLFFQAVSVIFIPKAGTNSSAWTKYTTKAYIGERQNSIDVLLIGNSNLYRGFSPVEVWKSYGIACCDAGKPSQTPEGAYDILRNSLQYQHPKVIVLETDLLLVKYVNLNFKKIFNSETKLVESGFSGGIKKIDESIEKKMDYYIPKLTKTGYTGIIDRTESALETEINYYFPLLKYHYRWNSLRFKDFTNMKANWHFADKGFVVSTHKKAYKGIPDYMTANAKNSVAFKDSTLNYLNKMNDLCRQNNIKLVLLSIPCANSWSISKHNSVAEFTKANKLDFVDLNMNEMNSGINWLKDTNDGGTHLNIYGARKVSAKFGAYLKENFQLTDHRSDPAYAQWTEDIKHTGYKF
ncbi:MAG: hypothetical protein WCN92_00800 [Eubacteriales bacterium]